jgi:hypothetical protein
MHGPIWLGEGAASNVPLPMTTIHDAVLRHFDLAD